jgi:MFS family permease
LLVAQALDFFAQFGDQFSLSFLAGDQVFDFAIQLIDALFRGGVLSETTRDKYHAGEQRINPFHGLTIKPATEANQPFSLRPVVRLFTLVGLVSSMKSDRWLRIIPVALIMYTISYVDRTNISLALDPQISTMMRDLFMDDKMKGHAAGIFFLGYMLLQIPGGHWATRWGARRVVSVCLILWGACAVGCGLATTFGQFELMRFLLGVAESGVFPATLVLLANWFPRAERARANAYWSLCQPLAVAGSAPITAQLLKASGWKGTLILEGALPFIWLPIWWFFIRDHPREAKWISSEERNFLETTLKKEAAETEPPGKISFLEKCLHPSVFIMILLYFLHNCAAYGCMTFFTSRLKGQGFSQIQYGILFAVPYVVTAIIMILNSWSSDRTGERRGHVAAVYLLSGSCLILSVLVREHFWVSYALLCLAIPGPFAALGPFWAIASETLPRGAVGLVCGLVNAVGNVGGYFGPDIVGSLSKKYGNTSIGFAVLGAGMLVNVGLAFLLPRPASRARQVVAGTKPEPGSQPP